MALHARHGALGGALQLWRAASAAQQRLGLPGSAASGGADDLAPQQQQQRSLCHDALTAPPPLAAAAGWRRPHSSLCSLPAQQQQLRAGAAGSGAAGRWLHARRWLHGSSDSGTQTVQALLDSMQGVKLRDALEAASEEQPFMSYEQLLDFIIKESAADTREEAHARADALVHAGVVLRFNGVVYLRPQEVAEQVYRTLPTDPAHARHNLADVEAELASMEQQHRAIYSQATRWTRFWLWTGCAALGAQLVGFTWLIYCELSWDVMEPVGYLVSLGYSLMAYLYFMFKRSQFDYADFQSHWTQQKLDTLMADQGFDRDKFQHLLRTRDRYKRYLAAAALQDGGGAGEAQQLGSGTLQPKPA